ncbi:hypothetical protein [Mucilaginibacter rubeus]|uniref:Uncharacterized protein n=1 Tax=Mucilaginibacter rubeus TaxID=2027860 RepID=A0A5C1IA70_9SPHI|nr:hypothetical protein [Mucilaginibacter rubeus]QEM13591.1 hypothetical protein DEO27_027460 [Mucilaginibacter rubeus]
MKKQLLWGVLLLAAGFSSCKKDSFKPVNDESAKGKSTKVNVAQPPSSYSDLVLQPRQPGETFDTYKCVFAGTEVKVMGTPTWNQSAYPTLVNGIPALGASYGVYTNANLILASTGVGQDFFSLSIFGINGLEWGTKFRDALELYQYAVATYTPSSGAPYPSPDTFIGSDFTSHADTYTVTGKLIRVTTGSHWALATVDYPTPAPSSQVIVNDIFFIQNNIQYSLKISGNTITGVTSVAGIAPPFTQIPAKGASGSCIAIDHNANYNINVTVAMGDGSVVNYQGAAQGGV